MAKKTKYTSSVLESVHDTAQGLFGHGFITKREMHRFDALCLPPIPSYTMARVKRLRKNLDVSQAVLASILNTSLSTVRQWEMGVKRPGGPSAKLLDLLDRKGLDALL